MCCQQTTFFPNPAIIQLIMTQNALVREEQRKEELQRDPKRKSQLHAVLDEVLRKEQAVQNLLASRKKLAEDCKGTEDDIAELDAEIEACRKRDEEKRAAAEEEQGLGQGGGGGGGGGSPFARQSSKGQVENGEKKSPTDRFPEFIISPCVGLCNTGRSYWKVSSRERGLVPANLPFNYRFAGTRRCCCHNGARLHTLSRAVVSQMLGRKVVKNRRSASSQASHRGSKNAYFFRF